MANQNLIFLEYTFLFDTVETFQHLYQFEKELFEFFSSKNFQAETIRSVEGAPAKRFVYISKKEEVIPIEDKQPVGRPPTLKGQIKKLTDRKLRKPAVEFMKGKK